MRIDTVGLTGSPDNRPNQDESARIRAVPGISEDALRTGMSCHVRATSSAQQCRSVQTHAQRNRSSTRPFDELWLAPGLPLRFFQAEKEGSIPSLPLSSRSWSDTSSASDSISASSTMAHSWRRCRAPARCRRTRRRGRRQRVPRMAQIMKVGPVQAGFIHCHQPRQPLPF